MAYKEELELAKTGIEQLGSTGREMLRQAADSSTASETGGLIADELRFRRFKRQIRIIQRAETLESRGCAQNLGGAAQFAVVG